MTPDVLCHYKYNGVSGGRKGQSCGRPEDDHCKGRADVADESHHDQCRLNYFSGVKSRPGGMVHHPFHRRERR